MKSITVGIVGTSPILMSSPKAMESANGSPKVAAKKVYNDADDAEARAYRLPSGQLYMPAAAFRASGIDGLKNKKIGKLYANKLLMTCMFCFEEFAPLHHAFTEKPITEYEIDKRRVVMAAGTAILRCRPLVRDWATRISFEFDDETISPDVIMEALTIAGRRVGVGDYRPLCPKGKGGPFGRFKVELVGVESLDE